MATQTIEQNPHQHKHRPTPKAEGGVYEDGNVVDLTDRDHCAVHGILRERDEHLEKIKALFDDHVQTTKLQMKLNNQRLALAVRIDHKLPEMEEFIAEHQAPLKTRLSQIARALDKALQGHTALTRTALSIEGLGPITVAALTSYVDLGRRACPLCKRDIQRCEAIRNDKKLAKALRAKPCPGNGTTIDGCSSPSALWAYAGLDRPRTEKRKKGVPGGGNKTLRTVLYNSACVYIKMKGESLEEWREKEDKREKEGKSSRKRREKSHPYRLIYDRVSSRLDISERIVKSRNTEGDVVEVPWKDTKPCHRKGAAIRAVMKAILVDYWLVGRKLQGLPTTTIYAEGMLGHTHIESPQDHGWPEV